MGRRAAIPALLCVIMAACGGSVDLDGTPQSVAVRRTERTWVDVTRSTPRTAQYAGASERMLRVLLWQPETVQPLPLLLMAHGFGGLPEKFDAFARTVAAAGFVVAAPAFPLTNQNAPGGHDAGFRDFIHQPADLSFVLTQLLQASSTPADPLYATLAADQVGLLGHSLGGATAIGMTRKQCCADARVRALILVAAVVPLADAFGNDAPRSALPTLLIQGTADQSVAYSTAPTYYEQLPAPRFLLGLVGVGHSEALESQTEPPIRARAAAQRASIAFLGHVLRHDPAGFAAVLSTFSATGDTVLSDPFEQ